MSDLTRRLDQAEALAEKAMDHIGRLCTREDRWTMTVPPRDDDSDVMLMQVAEDSHRAARAMRWVADRHQPEWVDHNPLGRVQACRECSEDRMFQLWPCPTVEALSGAHDVG